MNFRYFFLVRSWNCYPYLEMCLTSILQQRRNDYTILFVDDCSEYTTQQKKTIKQLLKKHVCIFNQQRQFSLKNAYDLIHTYAKGPHDIVINVDGDDWLSSPLALDIIDKKYQENNCVLTYGECYYHSPGTPLHQRIAGQVTPHVNRRYSDDVEQAGSYRKEIFYPLHLRTWKASAFRKIPRHHFQRPDGSWIKFCEDQAIFFPLLEMAKGNYQVIQTPLSYYNIENPLSDMKIHSSERLFDEVLLRRRNSIAKP